jgi:hypothetical protein
MTAIVVASHMRSGTHLTIDLLRRNASRISAAYLNLDRLRDHHGEPLSLDAFDRELDALGPLPLLKTHTPADASWFAGAGERSARAQALLGSAQTLYVTREGRDVLVSLFHYMRHFSERVRGQSFASFLRDRDDFFQTEPAFRGLDRVSAWASHVEGWLSRPDTVVLRYEDLLLRLEPTLRAALERLGLDAPDRISPIAVPADLPRRVLRKLLAPLRPRHFSTAVAPRRGVIGDASRHFDRADEAFFRERASAVLERLEAATSR